MFIQWLNLVWHMGLQRWVSKLSRCFATAQGALRAENRHVFAVVCHRFCLDPFGSIWWYENPDRHFLHNTVEASLCMSMCILCIEINCTFSHIIIQWYPLISNVLYILYLKLSYTLTQMLYESYVILAFIVVAIGSLCFGVPRKGMPKRFMLRLFYWFHGTKLITWMWSGVASRIIQQF